MTDIERTANNEARHGNREALEMMTAERDVLAEKLANAMDHVMDYSNDPHLVFWAKATLAELKGQDDE